MSQENLETEKRDFLFLDNLSAGETISPAARKGQRSQGWEYPAEHYKSLKNFSYRLIKNPPISEIIFKNRLIKKNIKKESKTFHEKLSWELEKHSWIPLVVSLIIFVGMLVWVVNVRAETVNVEKLADCIYLAEGGAKTKHPYGILAHYKKTTPRQACINTINHALRDWRGKGDFLSFLSSRYAPINANNDPKHLNNNWLKNVRLFYASKM